MSEILKCSLCGRDVERVAATFLTWGDRRVAAVICGDDWCDDSIHRWAAEHSVVLAPADTEVLATACQWSGGAADATTSDAPIGASTETADSTTTGVASDQLSAWSAECGDIARFCYDLAARTEDTVLGHDLDTIAARLEKLRSRMETA